MSRINTITRNNGFRDARFKAKKTDDFSSSESDSETADQKRKRLAQEHLDQLKQYGICHA